jgi:hypothetical protein
VAPRKYAGNLIYTDTIPESFVLSVGVALSIVKYIQYRQINNSVLKGYDDIDITFNAAKQQAFCLQTPEGEWQCQSQLCRN